MTAQEILTHAATACEIAIAAFTVFEVLTMPSRRKPSPGQLEIDFSTPVDRAAVAQEIEQEIIELKEQVQAVAEVLADVELLGDPWAEPVAPFSPLPTVAQLQTQPPYLRLLPPAKVEPQPAQPAKQTPKQLRDLCKANGIKWRNAHGKNKHLSVGEMRRRLAELGAIGAA